MILDEYVEVRWNNGIRTYYEDLGYICEGNNTYFKVKIHDLSKGSKIKLRVRCDVDGCNNEALCTKLNYTTLIDRWGIYRCRECAYKFNTELHLKHDIDYVKSVFVGKGYIPTFQTYKDVKQKLTFICPKHPEYKNEIALANLLIGQGCFVCGREKQAISNTKPNAILSVHLRGVLRNWVFDKMKEANFTCEISNQKCSSLAVHHITPFHMVRDNCLKELNIHLTTKNRNQLGALELKQLSELFLDKHINNPKIGIVLDNNIHNLFHKIYGKFKFTESDFYKFKEDYQNGVYT